jgi:ubiquinone/menaquinone biosynthesis C-methylase UbiE
MLHQIVDAALPPATGLSQQGRASMEILGEFQAFAADALRSHARATFEGNPAAQPLIASHKADATGADGRARIAAARRVAEADPIYRLERFLQRWVAEENFNTGIPAIEERRVQFEHLAALPIAPPAGGTLSLADGLVAPAYYDATEWHLEPGGWDGYDLYGALFAFAVGPLVFARGGYAAIGAGENIAQHRLQTVREFPKSHYDRIFEPGCGGATTLRALRTVFPDAELHGCDLSALTLRNGHRMAEKLGVVAHLKQRDVVDTGEPDETFDAVLTYALQHELPPEVNARMFTEMFRIMKPGADILLSDPPPFRAVDLFHAVLLDWDTANRDEPHFSDALHGSLDEQLAAAGFVDVDSYAIGANRYPWITRARKPIAEV